jgi:hypothetical protein
MTKIMRCVKAPTINEAPLKRHKSALIDVDYGTATVVGGHETIAIVVDLGSGPLPDPIW